MNKLTPYEKEVHQNLCERKYRKWTETSNQETQALNRLIKKGYATFDGEHREWFPVSQFQD